MERVDRIDRWSATTYGPAITRHPSTDEKCFSGFSSTVEAYIYFFQKLGTSPGASRALAALIKGLPESVTQLLMRKLSTHWRKENIYFFKKQNSTFDLSPGDHWTTNELIWKHSLIFNWRKGDLLFIDNIKVGHSRMPFIGSERSISAIVADYYDARKPQFEA